MRHLLIFILTIGRILAAEPIPITNIETLNGLNTAHLSFDGNTGTSWFQGWSVPTAQATITFDGTYEVSKIRYFDGTGQPTLNIYADNAATPLKSIRLTQYWVWLEESITVTTKSLTIEISGIQGDMSIPEIQFYGKKIGSNTPQPPSAPVPTAKTDAASQIGICGFHWVPMEPMKIFAAKRDFQMSSWTWTPLGFSPQPLYGGASRDVQGYDDYLTAAKNAGIQIIPCVNESPDWFWNLPPMPAMYTTDDMETPYYSPKFSISVDADTTASGMLPVLYSTDVHPKTLPKGAGGNKNDPFSYLEYGSFMFQYAARYGRQKWDTLALEVNQEHLYPNSPINQKKSGLDLLNYIEPWNEPDAWWLDTTVYAFPEQFGAFMSAVYDGNCGSMGRNVGIKIADSTMQVVMPGLTGADLNYMKRLVNWCHKHRPDLTLPWDVCNFHFYNNATNQAGRWPPTWTTGTPADMDPAWPDVIAFVDYCHKLNMPVWWTEMGYDSKEPSWQASKAYGPYTADSVQAMWLTRNYLMGIAAGIDKIFAFNAINEPGARNGGLYQNSGVLYGAGDEKPFTPKASYFALRTMISNLDGYQYQSDLSIGTTVKILAFSGKNGSMVAYWSPTKNNTKTTFKYQGKTLVAEETVKYLKFNRTAITKRNLFNKLVKPSQVPRRK